jgi:poly(A) polymerase
MEAFGLKEGREVGLIKNHIREAILEGDIKNSRKDALKFMLNKGIEMGLNPVKSPNN